jgi:hypothetical protein
VTSGACPAREAVISALTQAMPNAAIAADSVGVSSDAEPVVVISDDSAAYRMVVGGVVRRLVDPAFNCQERARKVAIVATLELVPAWQPEATRPAPSAGVGVRLESGAIAELAWTPRFLQQVPFSDTARLMRSRLSPFGGTARVTIDHGALGLVVGGTVVTWSDVYGADVQRIPVDVALQVRRRGRSMAAAVELGPSLVFQHSKDGAARWLHLEADLRVSGRMELWLQNTVGVFAAVTGTYVPVNAPVKEGLGGAMVEQPRMPSWWFGASAGVVLQIR